MLGKVTVGVVIVAIAVVVGITIYERQLSNENTKPIDNKSDTIVNITQPPKPVDKIIDDEAEYRSHWIFFHCYLPEEQCTY